MRMNVMEMIEGDKGGRDKSYVKWGKMVAREIKTGQGKWGRKKMEADFRL